MTDDMRRCKQCGGMKPLTEYQKSGYNPDGTQRYRHACKDCTHEYDNQRDSTLQRKYRNRISQLASVGIVHPDKPDDMPVQQKLF